MRPPGGPTGGSFSPRPSRWCRPRSWRSRCRRWAMAASWCSSRRSWPECCTQPGTSWSAARLPSEVHELTGMIGGRMSSVGGAAVFREDEADRRLPCKYRTRANAGRDVQTDSVRPGIRRNATASRNDSPRATARATGGQPTSCCCGRSACARWRGPHAGWTTSPPRPTSRLVLDSRFSHVLDVNDEDGLVYIVDEWVAGTDLASLLRTSGPLPPAEARSIAMDVAQALASATPKHLYHLALRPESVIRTDSGGIKIRARHGCHHRRHRAPRRKGRRRRTRAPPVPSSMQATARWPRGAGPWRSRRRRSSTAGCAALVRSWPVSPRPSTTSPIASSAGSPPRRFRVHARRARSRASRRTGAHVGTAGRKSLPDPGRLPRQQRVTRSVSSRHTNRPGAPPGWPGFAAAALLVCGERWSRRSSSPRQ